MDLQYNFFTRNAIIILPTHFLLNLRRVHSVKRSTRTISGKLEICLDNTLQKYMKTNPNKQQTPPSLKIASKSVNHNKTGREQNSASPQCRTEEFNMFFPLKITERNIHCIIYACFRKSIVFSGAQLVACRSNSDIEDFSPISTAPSLQERQRVDV